MSIELKDKLYTSTQVADILGVSLRTLYRYMEDGKIQSMRTASGRHRFTKDQILDFLNAGGFGGSAQSSSVKPVQVESAIGTDSQSVAFDSDDVFTSPSVSSSQPSGNDLNSAKSVSFSDMDWLKDQDELQEKKDIQNKEVAKDFEEANSSNFQSGVDRFSGQKSSSMDSVSISQHSVNQAQSQSRPAFDKASVEPRNEAFDLNDVNVRYYKSDYSDLIELARKIKDTAASKDLEYAFTIFAGLSLHFSIKPFTKLHFYANPEDMQIWKSELRLTPVQNRDDANIGVLVNTDIVFVPSKDIGGFKVVDDKVLMRDLSSRGEEDLVKQFRQHLMSS